MGILDTITETLKASAPATDRGDGRRESAGAYWCHDCEERLRAGDADADPPACPSCGEAMSFERSPDSAGCAC
ncbi:MAG: zinc-ribbon domain-containing protein [Haloplanus sp.]